MKYNYIFFDAAGTLLYKKDLYPKIVETLEKFGIKIERDFLMKKHKFLSEVISSPQKTSKEFYNYFNSQLLYTLGIIPTDKILNALYDNCVNLQWEKYSDTDILIKLNTKIGVISNWDESLPEKLKKIFDFDFDNIVYSSKVRRSKPDISIYTRAIRQSNVLKEEILYVGDSIKLDIEPALKAGLQAVFIDRGGIYPYFKGIKIGSLYRLKDILNG